MDSIEQNPWENIFVPADVSEMFGQECVDPLALPCCRALLHGGEKVSDASEG